MFKFLKNYWGFAVILILSFWAVKPLLISGFFPIHDDTQVTRVFEMGKALQDKEFPVRWVNDLGYGYGYPIFNFYAPLSYYIGGFFVLLGANALFATKLTMGIGILLAGITMYLFAREFWGETGGIVSGLFYQYALYHAVDIYVRGDMSEFWAYAWIPLFFYGFYKIFAGVREKKLLWKWVIIGAVGIAGIVLSHNLTAMIVALFALPYTLLLLTFTKKKIKTATYLIITGVFGLLLSAFYIIPVFFEMKYTNVLSQLGGTSDFHNHFICLSQFWYSPWGYGGSVPGCIDGLSFMLGKTTIFLAILAGIGSFSLWKKKRFFAVVAMISFICWIFSLFLTTAYSKYVWEIIHPMAFLQYPWRFLLMASFCSALLIGALPFIAEQYIEKKRITMSMTALMMILVLMTQGKYFLPQSIRNVSAGSYTNSNRVRWNISKISDEYMPKNFSKPTSEQTTVPYTFIVYPPAGVVLSRSEKTQRKEARVNGFIEANLVLGLAYFPAWHYFIDSLPAPYGDLNGKFVIRLPKGIHTLVVQFDQTPSELFGDLLSLSGLAGLLLGIMLFREKKSHT